MLPAQIHIWGKDLVAVGRGKYPYECEAKDKHPDAMIYEGDGNWTDQYSTAFEARDKTKDVFSRSLKYAVQPGDAGGYRLYNTQDDLILGGEGFKRIDEAFEACDTWNGVAPGATARSQKRIASATRLNTVTTALEQLGYAMMDATHANDSEEQALRSKQYEQLATEYIGLVAGEVAERQESAVALDKRLAAHDFAYQTKFDPLSEEYQRHSSTMDDLERLAKGNFTAARALWDKHTVAKLSPLGPDGLPAGWTEVSPGGMATNTDPVRGGIVDSEIVSGKWFAIFNDDTIPMIEGMSSRAEAFAAHGAALARIAVPATLDPRWRSQVNDLKRVTGAIDQAMAEYHADKFFVACEEFTLTVSANHGGVLKAVIRDEGCRAQIDQIDRFDVDEARDWMERFSDRDGIEGKTLEFAAIGHWKRGGTFVSPDEERRMDIELADNGVGRGARP